MNTLSPRPVSAAINDWAVLDEMKDCMRRHLTAALLECSAISRDLRHVDPDQVMVDLRAEFDPTVAVSPIQDCFSDAFTRHVRAVIAGEPISRRNTLPSGAVRSEQ